MYANHARDVERATKRQDATRQILDLIEKLRERVPSEDEFRAGFSGLVYSSAEPKGLQLVKYTLSELYRSLSDGAVVPDFDAVTLEHLAPQQPARKTEPFENYASIGNIILVSDTLNRELSNRPFGEKKARLLKARELWLDDVIRDAVEWDADKVELRTQILAGFSFSRVWSLQAAGASGAAVLDESMRRRVRAPVTGCAGSRL